MTFLYLKKQTCFFFFVSIIVSSLSANAAITWTQTASGTHSWSTASNWAGGVVPGPADDVVFNNPGSNQTITLSADVTVNSLKMSNIASPTYKHTLNFAGYTMTVVQYGTPSSFIDLTSTLVSNTGTLNVNTTSYNGGYVKINACNLGAYTVNITCPRLTLDRAVTIQSSTFNGAFTCTTKKFYLLSCTFGSAFTFTKADAAANNTNTTNTDDIASCTFNGVFTLSNSDIKALYVYDLTINAAATVTNSGTSSILFSNINTFATTADFNSTGAGSIAIGGTTTFNAATTFSNTSTGAIVVGNSSANLIQFNSASSPANVYFNNAGSGSNYIRISQDGDVKFNNSNVVIGNTNASGTVRIGHTSASTKKVTLSATSTLTVYPSSAASGSAPYFSTGAFYIDHLVVEEASVNPVNISLGLNATFQMGCTATTKIHRVFDAKFYKCISLAGEFFKNSTFTLLDGMTGTLTTQLCDLTTFNSNVTFISESGVNWYVGGFLTTTNAYFKSTTGESRSQIIIQNKGLGGFNFGYTSGNLNFNGVDLKYVRVPSVLSTTATAIGDPGNIYTGYSNPSCVFNIDAYSTLNIQQNTGEVASSATKGIYLGAVNSTTANFIVSGKTKINGITKGLLLLGGGFLAKNVNVPASIGLTDDVNLFEIIDAATTTDYRYLYFGSNILYGPVFEKKVDISFWDIGDYAVTFKEDTKIQVINGTSNRVWIKAVFEKDAHIIAYNSSAVRLGYNNISQLDFNGNLMISNYGGLSLGENGTICNIKGNLIWRGKLTKYMGYTASSTAPCGTITFNGTADQSISTAVAPATAQPNGTAVALENPPAQLGFFYLEVNKSAGILSILNPVVINLTSSAYITNPFKPQLKLTQGNILTSTAGLITIADNCISAGGGKHSYVLGPLRKIGNDVFKYHVGKPSKYFPLWIDAPSNIGCSFTAEFFADPFSVTPNTMDGSIKDVMDCQYWKMTSDATAGTTKVTLFWNNTGSDQCYTVNPAVAAVAGYRTPDNKWFKEGTPTMTYQYADDSGYVQSATVSNFNYFALGYRNALVVNTYKTNPTKFKIYTNVEKTSLFTSGASGSSAGSKTILSRLKDISGSIVVHPSFSSTVDLTIDQQLSGAITDTKAGYINYIPLNVKITTTAEGSTHVVDHVNIDEDSDNTYLPLLTDMNEISGNTLFFYKEKQSPNTFQLTNNLTDALTFTVNRYLTTPYVPFQITSAVPVGYSATLNVYKIDNTLIATNNSDLSWNGKVDATTFYAEGLYRYELELTNGTTTKAYKGQMILKHQ